MYVFFLILAFIPLATLAWWWRADRLARRLPRPAAWRVALGAFMLAQVGLYVALVVPRFTDSGWEPPAPLTAVAYVWSILVLPATVVLWAVIEGATFPFRAWRASGSGPVQGPRTGVVAPDETAGDAPSAERLGPDPSRRAFLGRTLAVVAVAGPPVAAVSGAAVGLSQMGEFRVRRLVVPLASLPAALDGLTIAQVTDPHVGTFTHGRSLGAIADATNALDADLVLLVGDLINHDLAALPAAAEMVRAMRARHGVFVVEGNHDLFAGREPFVRGCERYGVPLLSNQTATLTLAGLKLQILGQRWGGPPRGTAGASPARDRGDLGIAASFEQLVPRIDPSAFPILLAHHPHAFDSAARAGVPLTLSGHTHGGQIMLPGGIGPGPLMYRYWSGLYRRPTPAGGVATAVVSNGVGNWFPLRVNAPAEIIHLTLRRADPTPATA